MSDSTHSGRNLKNINPVPSQRAAARTSGGCPSPNLPHASAPTPPSAPSGRKRYINSCTTCRRRKVRCDREKPMCARCTISGYTCAYTDGDVPIVPPPVGKHGSLSAVPNASERPTQELLQRLQRLEEIVAAIDPGEATLHSRYSLSAGSKPSRVVTTSADGSPKTTDGIVGAPNSDATGLGAGKLLNEGGRIRYVSSLYWE